MRILLSSVIPTHKVVGGLCVCVCTLLTNVSVITVFKMGTNIFTLIHFNILKVFNDIGEDTEVTGRRERTRDYDESSSY